MVHNNAVNMVDIDGRTGWGPNPNIDPNNMDPITGQLRNNGSPFRPTKPLPEPVKPASSVGVGDPCPCGQVRDPNCIDAANLAMAIALRTATQAYLGASGSGLVGGTANVKPGEGNKPGPGWSNKPGSGGVIGMVGGSITFYLVMESAEKDYRAAIKACPCVKDTGQTPKKVTFP